MSFKDTSEVQLYEKIKEDSDLNNYSGSFVEIFEHYGEEFSKFTEKFDIRHYMVTKNQLMFYLIHSSPTKLIDGKWLENIKENDLYSQSVDILNDTLYEETGSGNDKLDHKNIYRNLLSSIGYPAISPVDELLQNLPEISFKDYYIQTMISKDANKAIALGYNFIYEQPSRDMFLVHNLCQYYGIDSKYFSAHITIDNNVTGHAKRALDAIELHIKHFPEDLHYVRLGMKLAENSISFQEYIRGFDLASEMARIMDTFYEKGSQFHHNFRNIESIFGNRGWDMLYEMNNKDKMERIYNATSENGVMNGVMTLYQRSILFEYIYAKKYDIISIPDKDTIKLEGGDIIETEHYIFVGFGFRTNYQGIEYLKSLELGKQIIPVKLLKEEFYHLDTCFYPELKKSGGSRYEELNIQCHTGCVDIENLWFTLDQYDFIPYIIIEEENKRFFYNKRDGIDINIPEINKGGGGTACVTNLHKLSNTMYIPSASNCNITQNQLNSWQQIDVDTNQETIKQELFEIDSKIRKAGYRCTTLPTILPENIYIKDSVFFYKNKAILLSFKVDERANEVEYMTKLLSIITIP